MGPASSSLISGRRGGGSAGVTRMPDYVVLISTLGGMATFGFTGFVIGPVIASARHRLPVDADAGKKEALAGSAGEHSATSLS